VLPDIACYDTFEPLAAAGRTADGSALYAPLPAGTARLRVLVLLDRDVVPAWVAQSLYELAGSGNVELLAAATVGGSTPRPLPWLLETYLRLDRFFAGGMRPVTAACALAQRLPQLPLPRFGGVASGERLWLDDAARREIHHLAPDLILSFGLPPADAALAAGVRHGIWSFGRHACDPLRAALWLIAPLWYGDAVTHGGLLVHRSDSGRWQLLQECWAASAQLSFARNRAYQLQKVPAQLRRAVRDLAQGRLPAQTAAPPFAVPGNWQVPAFGLRLIARALRRHVPRLGLAEHWFLALRRDAQALDPGAPVVDGFVRIEAPTGRFWADPCVFRHAGRSYIFVEEYRYSVCRGRIVALELGADLKPVHTHVVLEAPSHLSYPFVFGWQGEVYMVVESAAARRLDLYRARRFPDDWEPLGELLSGRAVVDATVHCEDGHWYLFANVADSAFDDGGRILDDLYLFHADSPLGPWRPHPANPLVCDVRHARPAGRLFRHGGRLIRPAQDCSTDYGYAIVFHEVLELSPQRYAERPLGRLAPDWWPGLRGCHTYSVDGDLQALDGKQWLPQMRLKEH